MCDKSSLLSIALLLLSSRQILGKNTDLEHFFVGHYTGVAVHPMNLLQKIPNVLSSSDKSQKVTDILHALLAKYDSRIRPFYPDSPVIVAVSLGQFQVTDVIDSKSEISSTVLLQQSWSDPRLAYETDDPSSSIPYITINHDHNREIWLPDTNFANDKKAIVHEMTISNDAVILYRNGTLIRSMRITVNTNCPFQYQDFPFDSQECEIVIGSHAYRTNDIRYIWEERFVETSQISQVPNAISHTGKFLVTSLNLNETTQHFNFGEMSRLFLTLTLQRAWRPFITRFYMPMILFVFVSLGTLFFSSFKISLIVNLFNLAFVNIFIAIRATNSDNPVTATKTAFDTYFVICMTYIGLVVLVTIQKLGKSSANPGRSRDGQSSQRVDGRAMMMSFDIPNENDIFSPNQDDADSIREDNDRQRIYRSPTYQLTFASRTRILLRKGSKFLNWFSKYLRWILILAFLTTDYIYFKIHSVRYNI